ncbi:hypothetical protein ANO11243_097470 [Dothideomycetidae sp. 11243]|nr:hypothetical protein ANO11243_097470 [fungal sp. No.11243]
MRVFTLLPICVALMAGLVGALPHPLRTSQAPVKRDDSAVAFQQKQIELHGLLGKAPSPEEAQKIQQQLSDLMKQQQDQMAKPARRSAAPLTPAQQLQQSIATEKKMIAQADRDNTAAQNKAIAATPGAGVRQMTIIPGRILTDVHVVTGGSG